MAELKDLLARLERVEERAKELNTAFTWQASRPPVEPSGGLEALSGQVEAQSRALGELRELLHGAESEQVRAIQTLQVALREAQEQLPRMIEAAPDRHDAVRRQAAYMQKRFREQFDAAVEEHVAARTRELESRLAESQSALDELQKKAAANDAQLADLRTTLADLTLEAARAPQRESEEPRSWYKTWRLPAAALVLLVLALVGWRLQKPVSETALLDQAGEAAVQKDFPRAESIYRDILKRNPKQEEALRGLGNALLLDSEEVMHTLPQ